MKPQIHILNGDALSDQFPSSLKGEQIVMRECLVDGSVKGKNLVEFYKTRANFLNDHYGGCTEEEYTTKVIVEFQKILTIEKDPDINLWFEDDLFCQVNLWFVSWLLHTAEKRNNIYLVRPVFHTRYGFGGLTLEELLDIFKHKKLLPEIPVFAKCWEYYRDDKLQDLDELTKGWQSKYPFLQTATEAHIARIPKEGQLGRPQESLLQIALELGTDEFGPVFQEFCEREAIYGFGDLQVKRLFDEVKDSLDEESLYKGLLKRKYEAFSVADNAVLKKLLRLEIFELLETKEEYDSEDLHIWGLTYYLSDDDKEYHTMLASEKFQEAYELDPDNFLACLYIAHCYHDQQRLEEALAYYVKVDQEALKDFQVWRYVKLIEQIGYCQYKLGRKEIGRQKFQEVLEWYKKPEWEDIALPLEMMDCLPETDEIIQEIKLFLP